MDRKICLDSDILVEILRGNREIINNLEELNANLYASSISIFEIWVGRLKKEEEKIKKLFQSLKKLDFDNISAIKSGDIHESLKENGDILDFRDIFIASSCMVKNIELYTNNKRHFERLKKYGLKLV
jgi:predicted nucleic acid-binding protein